MTKLLFYSPCFESGSVALLKFETQWITSGIEMIQKSVLIAAAAVVAP